MVAESSAGYDFRMARRRGAAPAPRGGSDSKTPKGDPFAGAKVWTRKEIEELRGSGPPEETVEEFLAVRRAFRERFA